MTKVLLLAGLPIMKTARLNCFQILISLACITVLLIYYLPKTNFSVWNWRAQTSNDLITEYSGLCWPLVVITSCSHLKSTYKIYFLSLPAIQNTSKPILSPQFSQSGIAFPFQGKLKRRTEIRPVLRTPQPIFQAPRVPFFSCPISF